MADTKERVLRGDAKSGKKPKPTSSPNEDAKMTNKKQSKAAGEPGANGQQPSIKPSQTLYLRNLDDKINKSMLRELLYYYCSQYGRVMDVVALKTMKMRGQAFVSYEDVASATNAMRNMQGAVFCDRPLVVQYGKSESVRVKRIDGTLGVGKAIDKKKEGKKRRQKQRKARVVGQTPDKS